MPQKRRKITVQALLMEMSLEGITVILCPLVIPSL